MDSSERVSPSGDEPRLSTRAADFVEQVLAEHGSKKLADLAVSEGARSAVDRILATHGSTPLASIRAAVQQSRAELERRGLTVVAEDTEAGLSADFGVLVDGHHRASDLRVITADDLAGPGARTEDESLLKPCSGPLGVPAPDASAALVQQAYRSHQFGPWRNCDVDGIVAEAFTALYTSWSPLARLGDAELIARHQVELMLLKFARAVQALRCPPPPQVTAAPEVSTSPCGVLRLRVREVPRAPGRGGPSLATTDHQRGAAA